MPPPRKRIPKPLHDEVLSEFRHLCALCGKPSPHLHHIDGDRNHNEKSNLLPVCPNHHLLDIHSPTNPIHPLKLTLFREYKDPFIFLPQFQPLFERLLFLLDSEDGLRKADDLAMKATDLIDFISHLQMGSYYAPKVAKLLAWNPPKATTAPFSSPGMPSYLHAVIDSMRQEEARKKYPDKVLKARKESVRLIIESLRYQPWKRLPPYAEA